MTTTDGQEPIVELERDGSKITILGTAHVSKSSADKVEELLLSGDYDAVAIELCESRYKSIMDPDALANLDLFQVVRQGKATMVAANLALGAFQQRMADELDIKPGAEMRKAIDIAKQKELTLRLIDRDITTTLKRVYRNVPWWQRINLIAGLFASVVSTQKVSEEEIEKLKSGDVLESVFSQFAEEAEAIYTPLVDERDQFMAAKIQQEAEANSFKNMLVVIGAGHMVGMKDYLTGTGVWQSTQEVDSTKSASGQLQEKIEPTKDIKKDESNREGGRAHFSRDAQRVAMVTAEPAAVIERLMSIPNKSSWLKFVPWVIVLLVIVGFSIGFSRNSDLGWRLIAEWVVLNGGLAAIGAIVAMAHPVTIITAFVAAPLTS
ncbi:MAG: TraB/GumN family protein, partial [Thiohalomonadales bacterium]